MHQVFVECVLVFGNARGAIFFFFFFFCFLLCFVLSIGVWGVPRGGWMSLAYER